MTEFHVGIGVGTGAFGHVREGSKICFDTDT